MKNSPPLAERILRPQPGPQTDFLKCRADVCIYGGAAGGGKSWAILADAVRWCRVPGYSSVMFRRLYPDLKQDGGLWPESQGLYHALGGTPNETELRWRFDTGGKTASIKMSHLQHEKDKLRHQGGQYATIYFDELTHFTEGQFWYLMSRNRSLCGVRPYVRAGTNPDPDSFVRGLVDWWIDEDGYPIPERSGVLRYFIREGGELQWFDHSVEDALSFTFIPASLDDNQVLLEKDPQYRSRLKALTPVERARLLGGNWNIRNEGMAFEPYEIAGLDEASGVTRGQVIVSMDPGGNWTGNPAGLVTLRVFDDGGRISAEVIESAHWWGVSTDRMAVLNDWVARHSASFVVLDNADDQLKDAAKARYGSNAVLHAGGTRARMWEWYTQLRALMANFRLRCAERQHPELRNDLRRLKLDGEEVIIPTYRGPNSKGQPVPIHCDAADALLRAMQAIGKATAQRGEIRSGTAGGGSSVAEGMDVFDDFDAGFDLDIFSDL